MIIDVRPTPAPRRHRARLVGALLGVSMLAAALFSIAELGSAAEPGPQHAPYSDPIAR